MPSRTTSLFHLYTFVDDPFGQDMHAKWVESLFCAALGALHQTGAPNSAIPSSMSGLFFRLGPLCCCRTAGNRSGDGLDRRTVLADRGFCDMKLYQHLKDNLGFEYVIRFRDNIFVEDSNGQAQAALQWVEKVGRLKTLQQVNVIGDRVEVPRAV
jgi:hypothetical protein